MEATADTPRLSCIYTARPVGSDWRQHRRCRLPISVGQLYHEGEKLKAVIDWVNRYAGRPFEFCEILVGDTAHRYYYRSCAGLDDVRAHQLGLREGDAWLQRNTATLASLHVQWRVVRWDERLMDPLYGPTHARVQRLFEGQPLVRATIEEDAAAFLKRKLDRGEVVPSAEMFLASAREFLLEELAIYAVNATLLPAVDVYPGQELRSSGSFAARTSPTRRRAWHGAARRV